MSPVCFVTEVLSTLRGSAPIARRKGCPQSAALRLCRPPLRSALSVPPPAPSPRVGRPLPLRLATPAFARWRSACTCRVSTRKVQQPKPRRSHHDHHSPRQESQGSLDSVGSRKAPHFFCITGSAPGGRTTFPLP